ncbi:PREDICTED: DNA primase large subunit-like [Polistes canadensis]|uniref:DNA primase large subunit-like n=1 Tax=Polistes canadensis TaxID=91411 RepID=UPI000718E03D|nr:PREDICTED: DNA primase large subunit-like [Polistes canadensis]
MDFAFKHCTITNEIKTLKTLYPHDLQVYDVSPKGEISLIEFQELALDRLKVLRMIENISLRTDLKTIEVRRDSLRDSLKKDGLKYYANLICGTGCKSDAEFDLQARKKDNISHHILRLAYCKDKDQAKWFMNQEVELFKMRFSSLDKEGVDQFLTIHKLNCKHISYEEKEKIREELQMSTFKITNIDTVDFYKIPFQKVIDLVRTRKVYLEDGMAYVPRNDLISLCISYFRQKLIIGIEAAKIDLLNASDDERLISFINAVPSTFSGMTRVVWSTTNTPIEKLELLSITSYPLCMRSLHEALHVNHHLKNSGRIQYGLFLKGIGVSLEDALQFWREAFSQKIDSDKFEKQYAYSIRHIYGKEGKQTNYTPLGCNKIISNSIGPGEYHGCPFRHMDQNSLKQKLSTHGILDSDIKDIAELAKEGHYSLACTRHFQSLHKQLPEQPIAHPNGYFAESRKIANKANDTTVDSTDSSMQLTNIRSERLTGTPRRSEAGSFTPSRVSEQFSTPSRRIEKIQTTPSSSIKKMNPLNIEKLLNDDEISELMDIDLVD